MSLSSKQKRAIPVLLSSTSYQEASAKLGVNTRTIYNWLNKPEFVAELEKAESVILSTVSRGMTGGVNLAVETLLTIIKDPKSSRREKISACRCYLQSLPQMRLLSSIEDKLLKLTTTDNEFS